MRSVMVAARTVHMSVVDFFAGGITHAAHIDVEVEDHARQGMIAVYRHFVAVNLNNHDCMNAAF